MTRGCAAGPGGLAQAVIALPYYGETNPGMVRQASHALREILAASPA